MGLSIGSGRRAGLSFGTAALIFVTTFTLAAACFLAAYSLGGHQVNQLNQAGFVLWPDAANLDMRESLWDQAAARPSCSTNSAIPSPPTISSRP